MIHAPPAPHLNVFVIAPTLTMARLAAKPRAECSSKRRSALAEGRQSPAYHNWHRLLIAMPLALVQTQSVQGDPGKPLKVLIVDDNQDAADSLAAVLGIVDYDTRVTYGGAHALECAGRYGPTSSSSTSICPD